MIILDLALLCMLFLMVIGRRTARPVAQSTQSPTYSPGPGYKLTVRRDGTLRDLALLLNSQIPTYFPFPFDEERSSDYVHFITMIEKWVTAPPTIPVRELWRSDYTNEKLDCGCMKYAGALTGRPLVTPRFIVDFVPFGYDIDLLHVRLHESYLAVDAFVIYESPRTQSGLMKPLYFNMLMNSSRFTPYASKIIYLHSTVADLQGFHDELLHARTKRVKILFDDWALEYAMRTEVMRLFTAIPAGSNVLKDRLMTNTYNVWALQNDADEMPAGKVLWHLKHCEIKKEAKAVYLPCFSFKNNFVWLQQTHDMRGLQSDNSTLSHREWSNITSELSQFLWRGAPYLWPLRSMLHKGSTKRSHHVKLHPEQHHMGIGAAAHMSSVSEPSAVWLKRGGIIEESFAHAIPASLLLLGYNNSIAPSIIASYILPVCSQRHPIVHIDTLSNRLRAVVVDAVPKILRDNPASFPFLMVGFVPPESESVIAVTSSRNWSAALCPPTKT